MFSEDTKEYCRKNKPILLLFVLWTIRLFFLLQGNAGGVAINKYVVVQLFAELGIAFCLFSRGFNFGIIFSQKPIVFFSLLYLWGVASIAWGVLPIMGSYFALQNLIMLAALYYLASSCKDFFQLERFYIFANIFILVIFLFRGLLWGGFHSVTYSTVGGLLLVYCAAEYDKVTRPPENLKMLKRGMWIGGLVLILATSSGAMVSVAGGLFVLAFFAKNNTLKLIAFLTVTIGLVCYFSGVTEWLFSILFPGKSMWSISTANGRAYIWGLIFEKAAQRPWLGWGYASVERILDIYCTDAHNSFVGILGSLGYIGCGILCLSMISLLFFVFGKQNIRGFRGLLAASVCGLINSNTSNFLGSKSGLQSLCFQMVIILAAVYANMYEAETKVRKHSDASQGKLCLKK